MKPILAIASCAELPNLCHDDATYFSSLPKVNELFQVYIFDWRQLLQSNSSVQQFFSSHSNILVMIRNTWDYQHHIQAFLQFLDTLHTHPNVTHIFNPVDLMKWNVHKKYLFDLHENYQVNIIPSILLTTTEILQAKKSLQDFLQPLQQYGSKFILKPCISAGSDNTVLFDLHSLAETEKQLREWMLQDSKDYLLQAFVPEIQTIGEYSILFVKNQISHCVVKKAKENEFRIQEQFGGKNSPINLLDEGQDSILNTNEKLIQQEGIPMAKRIVEAMQKKCKEEEVLLFARVDLIIFNGKVCLAEIELIEPSLYFSCGPHIADLLIEALAEFKTK